MTTFSPGAIVWRIPPTTASHLLRPLRCIIVGARPGGMVAVRSSTFSRDTILVPAGDLFESSDAGREEITRRALS
jgi:hypothetical protein